MPTLAKPSMFGIIHHSLGFPWAFLEGNKKPGHPHKDNVQEVAN
jgi:hypothetical protein